MDVVLKIPALEQLLKMASSGIGAVAGPMLGRWKARVQADALRVEAGGKADAIGLIAAAQAEAADKLGTIPASARTDIEIRQEIKARLTFQEEKRQRNIESVVRRAADELGQQEVDAKDIAHDWTAAFFSDVQDVSSEAMQQIWAKILAGEVQRPGKISIQTLSILKTMSQKDAQLFQSATRFVVADFILQERDFTDTVDDFPSHMEFMRLSEHNLLHLGVGERKEGKDQDCYYLPEDDMAFAIAIKSREKFTLGIPAYTLSMAGLELYNVIKQQRSSQILGALASYLHRTHGAELAFSTIVSRDGKKMSFESWTIIESKT